MTHAARRSTLLLFLLMAFTVLGQTLGTKAAAKAKGDPRWTTIDSLQAKGLFASALERTNGLLAEAQRSGDQRMEFRCWMYRGRLLTLTGGEAKDLFRELEARVSALSDSTFRPPTAEERFAGVAREYDASNLPLRPLLHSVLAEGYWRYYRMEHWLILERTMVDEPGDDVDTWDQRAFMARIMAHAQASLAAGDTLGTRPALDLGELLSDPYADMRPATKGPPTHERSGEFEDATVFDVLARRASVLFNEPEARLAEPAWRFRLDDPRLFDLYDGFARRPLKHRDSTAWEFLALRTYQEWERSHLSDDDPIALTDISMARLAFVHLHSTLPEKDSLYYAALGILRTRVTELPIWSEVTVAMAQWRMLRADRYQRLGDQRFKWERKAAVELCDAAIAHAPGSFGASNARALKARVVLPMVSIEAEEAVVPEAPFKLALSYSNVSQVWLRVVQDHWHPTSEWYSDRDPVAQLLKQRPLRQWNVALPDDGDLNRHLVELPVDGLPTGRYVVLVSNSASFNNGIDAMAFARFRSTRISVVERRNDQQIELLVLDRESGAPFVGAKAEMFLRDYATGAERFVKMAEHTTDGEGRVLNPSPEKRGSLRWRVSLGADEYYSDERWWYEHGNSSGPDTLRTFLFTDRAIYRPGQPLYFKGIVTVRRGGTTVVIADHATTVMVHDANNRVVDSIQVVTDAFGAFHGIGKAPAGLTGRMRLQEKHGSIGFQVEEYKRPKFEVTFDPVSATPKLGEEAEVTGMARSYAGVPVNAAAVRWSVLRRANMPWWCGTAWQSHAAWGQLTQVASGTAETDGLGHFTVRFTAEPDRSLPPQADPTFTYTVEASATDINGETQQSSTELRVGYRSIDIDLGLNDALDRATADSLLLVVRNLSGQPVDLPMDVRMVRLQAPARLPRERSWERPDRFVLDSSAHAQRFPKDVYDAEDDPLGWPVEAVVLDLNEWRSQGKKLPLPEVGQWPTGSYRIEVLVRGPEGREARVQRTFTLFAPENGKDAFLAPFRVEAILDRVEPGNNAVLLLTSALPEARMLLEVEREGSITERRTLVLHQDQQRVEIPVMESDRGGFIVHLFAVAEGRVFSSSQRIEVPWSNKELKVDWMSFRDKLLPGAKEEWRLRISGPKGDQVAAQLLTTLYDASLDRFVPHRWAMFRWPEYYGRMAWGRPEPFDLANAEEVYRDRMKMPSDTVRSYPWLRTYGAFDQLGDGWYWKNTESLDVAEAETGTMDGNTRSTGYRGGRRRRSPMSAMPMAGDGDETMLYEKDNAGAEGIDKSDDTGAQPVRTDFRETAFFFPDLLTDRDGSVVLRFTMPEAITRWKLMGLAHTPDLKLAQFERETVTRKQLMVTPDLPRFLREGDRIVLKAKIDVLEGAELSGTARLELFDPHTNKPLEGRPGKAMPVRTFTAKAGESVVVAWSVMVEPGVGAVAVRITATAGSLADGEERVLPVITDRVLVTESLPITITRAGTHSFALDKLRTSNSSTLQHQGLTLEFTPNPAWYAVQALPYLMEFPHECAEQLFSRYYANRLAASVVENRPAIKAMFAAWKASAQSSDKGSFLATLEKNPELKSVLLEETPWVVQANSERERRERLALLFDLERMATEEATALRKLQQQQLSNGAWPWFAGMQASRSITQHIVAGMGHLERLGAADLRADGPGQQMLQKAVRWLDAEADKDHKERLRRLSKEELAKYRVGYAELHYLLARSYFPRWPAIGGTATAQQFLKDRLAAEWLGYGLQEQAMIALVLERMGDRTSAQAILASLKERATQSAELGMYWKGFTRGMDWNSFPTETHALLIEAFHEVAADKEAVDGLRQYLLNLKRSTDWGTTKATAEACYALLLTGDDWLEPKSPPQITVGGEAVKSDAQEAGSGQFQHTWSGPEVKPAMGEVRITTTTDGLQWGALHWQYLEQMDKVTAQEGPFSIRKQVMLKEAGDSGPQLVALDKAGPLKPGDLLSIRIELRTDRWLDFIHLKDLRAAGLEPVEVLSGHRYQGGLGYYQSVRDVGMHFFFDRIAPGTYVFTYDLRVTHAGEFSNGIASAQCMYAPEFGSHSAGLRITVE
jgi:hypothetical protein